VVDDHARAAGAERPLGLHALRVQPPSNADRVVADRVQRRVEPGADRAGRPVSIGCAVTAPSFLLRRPSTTDRFPAPPDSIRPRVAGSHDRRAGLPAAVLPAIGCRAAFRCSAVAGLCSGSACHRYACRT
jgi:hypothetical protein